MAPAADGGGTQDGEPDLRLLIADDHAIYRRALVRVCHAMAGFEVVAEAANGDAALAGCRRLRPDVLLMDDELPGGGGLPLARQLRRRQPECAIVLFSLRSEEERREKERDPAIDRCLAKTTDAGLLAAELRAAHRRAVHRRSPPTRGDALADLAARVSVQSGRPATNPPETAAALLAAIREPGRTLALAPGALQGLAARPATDRQGYRLAVVADALRRGQPFDPGLVGLSLLLDQGEQSASGRWALLTECFGGLAELLAARDEPVLVLLGEGGAGKTTLLRRLAAATALAALGAPAAAGPPALPFFVQLHEFQPAGPSAGPEEAADWLARHWSERQPDLPPLAELVGRGELLLLLDDLLPVRLHSAAQQQVALAGWGRLARQLAAAHPGNRILFSGRAMTASEPLSSPALRVPHAQLKPLTEAQIRDYLERCAGEPLAEIWPELATAPQLEILRRPFYLALFGAQLAHGEAPRVGQAALLTSFVRRAIEREVARGNGRVLSAPLLAAKDLAQLAGGHWRSPWELPETGRLLPRLADLAYERLRARDTVPSPPAASAPDALATAILAAGAAIDVLAYEGGSDGPPFRHQILQEYFAARRLARAPEPDLVRVEWRADLIAPPVAEVLAGLDPAAELPAPAPTGWEDVVQLATAMADDPTAHLEQVMAVNLVLAGRLAAQPEIRQRLPEPTVDRLRWALVRRSRDPAADLRHRIAAGLALGELGDPRLERRAGPFGEYLLPRLVTIPAGSYPIGTDEAIDWEVLGTKGTTRDHCPRHAVGLAAFRIGRTTVTNAEFGCFVAAGGYDDEQWWDTANGRAWRSGELTRLAQLHNAWTWRRSFAEEPALLERLITDGKFESATAAARWRGWMALDDAAFAAAVDATWAPRRFTEPAFWREARYNVASQPVVGVSWYEARAYCRWLAAQSGIDFRLPTEVQWEAAARGRAGRTFPWGESFDPLRCNLLPTQLLRAAPVGVFPEGDTPEGICDLMGNVDEWTSSAIRRGEKDCLYCYPYNPLDGREDPEGPPDMRRSTRGGSFRHLVAVAQPAFRQKHLPDSRGPRDGFRLAADPGTAQTVGAPA